MEKIKRNIIALIAVVLISFGLNVFLIPSKLVTSGILGLTTLLKYNYSLNIPVILLIINAWTLWLVYMIYGKEKFSEYFLPSILSPLVIFLTSFLKINITNQVETLLLAISGASIMGYGYSLLYKHGYKIGAINILENMYNDFTEKNSKIITTIFDILLILISINTLGLEKILYSTIVIVIIRSMTTKVKVGISDSKAFYIITSKEKEIKKYLIEELHQDLTLFDAEGGYTKKKSKIIMTVIATKDYFKVKEGIRHIDKNAFISVTDSYEVINKNVKINEE